MILSNTIQVLLLIVISTIIVIFVTFGLHYLAIESANDAQQEYETQLLIKDILK